MRQQKNHSRIIFIILISLFLLLNIPKTHQLNQLLGNLLNEDEMMFYLSYRSFFILLALGLELLGAFLNIYILKYVYHFAKVDLLMPQNINLYLLISCITKLLTLFIPGSMMNITPLINSVLFSLFYLGFHYLYGQDKAYPSKTWAILISYPVVNLLFAIL